MDKEWIKKIYAMDTTQPLNEILPFVTRWMDLEGITLNKLDRERQIP